MSSVEIGLPCSSANSISYSIVLELLYTITMVPIVPAFNLPIGWVKRTMSYYSTDFFFVFRFPISDRNLFNHDDMS